MLTLPSCLVSTDFSTWSYQFIIIIIIIIILFVVVVVVVMSKVTEEWRKLHNEEMNDLHTSPSIVRVIKSRRMRWAGHVALMG